MHCVSSDWKAVWQTFEERVEVSFIQRRCCIRSKGWIHDSEVHAAHTDDTIHVAVLWRYTQQCSTTCGEEESRKHRCKHCRILKCCTRKDIQSTCYFDLQDTHKVFWWETLHVNQSSFVRKKTAQGTFNDPSVLICGISRMCNSNDRIKPFLPHVSVFQTCSNSKFIVTTGNRIHTLRVSLMLLIKENNSDFKMLVNSSSVMITRLV